MRSGDKTTTCYVYAFGFILCGELVIIVKNTTCRIIASAEVQHTST